MSRYRDLESLTELLRKLLVVLSALFPASFLAVTITTLAVDNLNRTASLALACVSLAVLVVLLATMVVFCRWIFLAHLNIYALGARNLGFTPRSAVAWFLVPIAWWWMPYRAMRELYWASRRPTEWTHRDPTNELPDWWFFWLLGTNMTFVNPVGTGPTIFVGLMSCVFWVVGTIKARWLIAAIRSAQHRAAVERGLFG